MFKECLVASGDKKPDTAVYFSHRPLTASSKVPWPKLLVGACRNLVHWYLFVIVFQYDFGFAGERSLMMF